MSTDEERLIIFRMMEERKKLEQRGIAVRDEVRRIATGLAALAETLERSGSIYTKDFLHLTQDQIDLLDAPKLVELLKEAETTGQRYYVLRVQLEQVGFGDPIRY